MPEKARDRAVRAPRVPRSLYAVLMAGGSGTRFWPASRVRRPKQLLRLAGEQTLIQDTLARIRPLVGVERVVVVTARAQARAVARQLAGLPAKNLLVEPCPRNTAACAGLAAMEVVARDPDAVLALFPADHVIAAAASWRRLVAGAARVVAATGSVVTFGIEPSRPETGFGYIRTAGAASAAVPAGPGAPAARPVEAFVEKPDLDRAREFVRSGRYLWNSGVFVAGARHLLDLIGRFVPEIGEGIAHLARLRGARGYATALARTFRAFPSVSLDASVMEKASGLLVMPARVGWSDVGSWSALDEVLPADRAGNVALGPSLCLDSQRCVVYSSGALVAALGVADLVVVQTPDAVLVCPKERAQDVRRVVERLRGRSRDDLL
jgi:mannose-1-phosphate guanylyltransferase